MFWYFGLGVGDDWLLVWTVDCSDDWWVCASVYGLDWLLYLGCLTSWCCDCACSFGLVCCIVD